ncbi:MAG: hypothetical protein IT209_00625 [Armatimonadetes bacterium]|nr:hypothetical protein [Armatimonadota bacterium]
MSGLLTHIPEELKALRQWILWRGVLRDGDLAKVPIDVNGAPGAQVHPERWVTFEEALAALERNRADGLGFAFCRDSRIIGIDLDDCVDEGSITRQADRIVRRLNSYTEASPSKTGLHIYVMAEMPGKRNRCQNLEIYPDGRFFTVTGERWPGVSEHVEERQQELNDIYAEYFPPEPLNPVAPAGAPLALGDEDLLAKAFKAKNGARFSSLWYGDTSAYNADDSRADLALCRLLAFWTGGDPAQIDRLFRASALYRPKWERIDYRARTIECALTGQAEFYNGHKPESTDSAGEDAEESVEAGAKLRDYNLTDIGNAERMAHLHGDYIRFCYTNSSWYVWTGKQWLLDTSGAVERRAISTIRGFYREAGAAEEADRRKVLAKWALTSEAGPRVKAMIEITKASVPVSLEEFDRDVWLLNCRNGVVDLRTGNLLEHDPRLMQSKIAPVLYEPGVDQSLWLSFLADATGGDTELMAFLQRAVGYSVSASVNEEVLLFVHGPGASGKSTFIESIRSALGDYATTLDFEVLLKKDFSSGGTGPNAELAKLPGVRFAASEEVDQGKKLAEGLVKNLTGNTQISARAPHAKRATEFVPQFKLWLVANDAPNVRADDDALWRRILRCPFEQVVPPEKRDRTLKERLRDPAIGGKQILAWAVQGCLDWLGQGLNPPEGVIQATEKLRTGMDPLSDWIEDRCVLSPSIFTRQSELRQNYDDWCHEVGARPVGKNTFAASLRRVGGESHVSNSVRGWFGIGLKLPESVDPVRPGSYCSTTREDPRNTGNQAQNEDFQYDSTTTPCKVPAKLSHEGSFPQRSYSVVLDSENGQNTTFDESVTVRKNADGTITRYLPDGSVEI